MKMSAEEAVTVIFYSYLSYVACILPRALPLPLNTSLNSAIFTFEGKITTKADGRISPSWYSSNSFIYFAIRQTVQVFKVRHDSLVFLFYSDILIFSYPFVYLLRFSNAFCIQQARNVKSV